MATNVELRLLAIVLRLVDPRRWRQRMAQLTAMLAAAVWVWQRAVTQAPQLRIARDVQRAARQQAIRARTEELTTHRRGAARDVSPPS